MRREVWRMGRRVMVLLVDECIDCVDIDDLCMHYSSYAQVCVRPLYLSLTIRVY
jgi:hypothetical protein